MNYWKRHAKWLNMRSVSPQEALQGVSGPKDGSHVAQLEFMRRAGAADYLTGMPWGYSLNRCQCEFCSRAYEQSWDAEVEAEVERRR